MRLMWKEDKVTASWFLRLVDRRGVAIKHWFALLAQTDSGTWFYFGLDDMHPITLGRDLTLEEAQTIVKIAVMTGNAQEMQHES